MKNKENFVYLFLLQFSNGLMPLFAFVHLAAILDSSDFSEVVIAESMVLLTLTLAMYSFEITSAKQIVHAKRRNLSQFYSDIFSSTIQARLALITISTVVLLIFNWLTGLFSLPYFIALLGMPFGSIFHHYYFYNAIENNRFPAVASMVLRLIFLSLIVVLVRGNDDTLLFCSLYSASYLISGLLCTLNVLIGHRVSFRLKTRTQIQKLLYVNRDVFISMASVFFYRDVNIPIMAGLTPNPEFLVIYSLCEKLVKVCQAFQRPISRYFLPKIMAQLDEASPLDELIKVSQKYLKIQVTVVAVFLLSVYLTIWLAGSFRNPLIDYFQPYLDNFTIFFAMSLVIVFGVANYTFGAIGLNSTGRSHIFRTATLSVGLINLLVVSAASYLDFWLGVVFTFSGIELILLIMSVSLATWNERRRT